MFFRHKTKPMSSQGFRKYINNLHCGWNMRKLNSPLLKVVTSDKTINLNMFCLLMKNRILDNNYSTLVVMVQRNRAGNMNTHVCKKPSQLHNLASSNNHSWILKLCIWWRDNILFLLFYKLNESTRKIQYLLVDLWS